MTTLTSIPGYVDGVNKLADGKSTSAGDGKTYLDLPFTQEFRVKIIEAEAKQSQAGNAGLRYKLEIVEDCSDGIYVGQLVWGGVYFTGHEFQGQQLATLHASVGTPPADSLEQIATQIVGGQLVIALKPNDQDPRYPQIRWLNADRGQKLNAKVSPPKGTATPSALKADHIPGLDDAPASAPAPVAAPSLPTAPAAPATVAPTGGLKLPGQ